MDLGSVASGLVGLAASNTQDFHCMTAGEGSVGTVFATVAVKVDQELWLAPSSKSAGRRSSLCGGANGQRGLGSCLGEGAEWRVVVAVVDVW